MPVIEIEAPGSPPLALLHVIADFNGTLARDGVLIAGVRERLVALASLATVHVVTADTFGSARASLSGLDVRVIVLPPGGQAAAKADYARRCGAERTAAIGNGNNDRELLRVAALSIAVLGEEGTAAAAVDAAQVVTRDILIALDLLLHPQRLVATLRQ